MNTQLNFHDGYIDGLYSFGSQTRIFLRTISGGRFTLKLDDIEALLATNMRKSNIILSLEFLQLAELATKDIVDLYQYSDEHMRTFTLDGWRKKAEQQNLKVLRISPSYGCELLAVFKRHEFMPGYGVEN